MPTERRTPRCRQGGPGPALARHAQRADRAVPGGQAGARLLRLRAADRVRHDLVAPGLAVRDRSLITVAMLAALGHPEELRAHLAGALNVGLTARSWSRC